VVLRGGRVIDPARRLDLVADVAFRNGTVLSVGQFVGDATSEVNVSGSLVVPGLVDLHAHAFTGQLRSVDLDEVCPPNGVSAVADAGTTGWPLFPAMRQLIIERVKTRVRAFVNLSSLGLLPPTCGAGGELEDTRYLSADDLRACIREHRDVLAGVKLRVSEHAMGSTDPRWWLDAARKIADDTESKIMVHVSGSPIPLAEIVRFLGPGDIVTHVFNGHPNGVLDDRGRVPDTIMDAQRRGIVFDVGHASVHFDETVARAAMKSGFAPDTFGTDLHDPPPGRVVPSVLGVARAMQALGMPLLQTVAAMTATPARAAGWSHGVGTLESGVSADATVIDLEGESVVVRPRAFVFGGRLVSPGAAS
jgi:dihydroorotase